MSDTTITAPPLSEAPPPAKTWKLRIGAYKGSQGGTMILFSFPGDIMKKFPASVKVERLDEENWKFSQGAGSKFTPYHSNRVKVSRYDPKARLFRSSPGEAIENGDDVLVYCPLATRGEFTRNNFWPKPASVKEKPLPPAPIALRTLSLEAGMREVIREIREIESACPYRLTRLDNGQIVWRAPVIE